MRASHVVAMLVIGGVAHADSKTDAPKQADAAKKTEMCEKNRQFLAVQEAKGRCKAELAEAKKITCSETTYAQMEELVTKCNSAADKPEELVPGTKCRALDPKDPKVILAEGDDKLSTKCLAQVVEKLKQTWCTDENKGKKFEYTTEYDHVLGAGKYAKRVKGTTTSLTCKTVAKK